MKIVDKREKIIFTEKEAEAIVLVHKLMGDIRDDAASDEVIDSAASIAGYLDDFIDDSFEDVDCVVADSTKEIAISIAIKLKIKSVSF